MDILQLVNEIEDLLEDASSVPLSRKVMVDPDEMYEILGDIRQNLPEEIKQARWITEEKERILTEAQQESNEIRATANKDADRIRTEAQNRLTEMINERHYQDHRTWQEIEVKAEQNARAISLQATTYIDDMFANAQEKLSDLMTILDESRAELRSQKK